MNLVSVIAECMLKMKYLKYISEIQSAYGANVFMVGMRPIGGSPVPD